MSSVSNSFKLSFSAFFVMFITSCSSLSSDISGKYVLEKTPTYYIQLRPDKTFYLEEQYVPGGKMIRTTGKYNIQDKEVILTVIADGSEKVFSKMIASGSKLTLSSNSKTVFIKE